MPITEQIGLQEALAGIATTRVDAFKVPLRELQYDRGHSFKVHGETYEFPQVAWLTACGYLDIPGDLLPNLGQGLGRYVVKRIHAVGRRAWNAPEEVRLYVDITGEVVAMSDARIDSLPNREVVGAVRDALLSHLPSETVSVDRFLLAKTEFEVAFHTPQLSTEPRPGDVLNGGVSIRHSQVGLYPTVVLSYVHRLVCSNGMTQRICLQGRPARTRRCKAGNPPDRTVEAIKLQIQQAWEQLEERLAGVSRLLDHRLDTDELPDGLRRRWSINRDIASQIAKAMQEDELGRTYTEYDLVNAISRVATHSHKLAPRYQRHLSLAAGMFAQRHVHQCPICGSWLASNSDLTQAADQTEVGINAVP